MVELKTWFMASTKMIWHHPKYYKELEKIRKQFEKEQADKAASNKPTSAQAPSDKRPSHKPRVQASSQKSQAPKSDDQGTSAQALCPGYKQRG